MILVITGTYPLGFPRLVKKMDEIAGNMDEKIVIQVGNTDYMPKNAEYFKFKESEKEIEELCQKARVVVCHGGAGTIITALNQGASIIAVPRLKKYRETYFEHGFIDIVEELAKEGRIKVIYEEDKLEKILKDISIACTMAEKDKSKRLISALRNYIDQLESQLSKGGRI